jgi:hypothetical protein
MYKCVRSPGNGSGVLWGLGGSVLRDSGYTRTMGIPQQPDGWTDGGRPSRRRSARGRAAALLVGLVGLVGSTLAVGPSLARAQPAAPADPDAGRVAPGTGKREALFDIAVAALVHGDLDVSERAFMDAAAVPGDPVRTAVAASFAERVRRLRIQRVRSQPFVPDDGTGRAEPSLTAAVPRRPPMETSQRTTVLGVTSLLGVTLYGWTLPVALGLSAGESARTLLGVYMLTSASAFVGPYLLTRNRPVSAGQANLVFYGGTRGIWHGVLAGALLLGDMSPDRRPRAWAASMLLGSATELVGGFLLAGQTRMTAGHARTMAALGDFGLLWGVAGGYFLRFPDRATVDQQSRGMATSTLVGSALGLTGGYLLGRRREHSWGDGEVLRMSGFVGGLVGLGAADLFDLNMDFRDRRISTLAVVGSVLGLAVGDRLTRNTEFSPSQSMILDLAAVAGGLAATGIAYVVTPQADDGSVDPPVVMTAALGSAAAFSLGYWALHDRPAGRPRPRLAPQLGVLPTLGTRGERGLALSGRF